MKKMIPLDVDISLVKCYNRNCNNHAVGEIEVSTMDDISGTPLIKVNLNSCEECAKGFGYEL